MVKSESGTSRVRREIRYLARYPGEVLQTTFLRNHKVLTLSAGPKESVVNVFDTAANKTLAEFRTDTTRIQSTATDAEARYVALSHGWPDRVGEKFHVKIVRTVDRQEVLELKDDGPTAYAVALSPDGSRLATASLDGEVKVWEVPSGKQVAVLRLDGEPRRSTTSIHGPASLVFSPDGARLAAVHPDGSIGFWNVETGRIIQRFVGHGGRVFSLAFHPNGRFLASAAELDPSNRSEPTVKVWDLDQGGEAYPVRGLSGGQFGVAFSPDGSRLLTAGEFGVTNLWEAHTGRFVFALRKLASPVKCVAFSPDGAYILTGEKGGFLILWDGTP